MTLTAVRAGAYLHHVAFESANPQRLAEFYADARDMDCARVNQDEWICEGPGRRMVVRRGVDKRMAYCGLACRDAEGLREIKARAMAEGLEILPSPSAFFQAGAFAVRDPDGHVVSF